jgi:hypothetical protein
VRFLDSHGFLLSSLPKIVGYWYVSTPYSLFPGGTEEAWRVACLVRGKLFLSGINAYSPIAETHALAKFCDLSSVSHEEWMDDDKPKMDGAGGILFVHLPGWANSVGMNIEREYFEAAHKPVIVLEP